MKATYELALAFADKVTGVIRPPHLFVKATVD